MIDDTIHIEPSSRCTLRCPQCPRTEYIDRISIDDCDIDSTVRACNDYPHVLMCGNHGDPIYHAKFHELIRALKADRKDRSIRIITNGAFRTVDWWEQLAPLLDSPGDCLTFSIDGISDNNHIYRVNSKWPTIEQGIKAVRRCNPTITIIWKWILFRYNEDQVLQGIELARQLGCNKFIVVKSVRYEEGDFLTPNATYEDIKESVRLWQ